jgi:OmpA-OmpF porin, OOP family
MNNTLAVTLLSSCALLLGACTTDLEKSQAAAPSSGSEFTRALTGHYREMAPNQWDAQRDFSASEHFARKAMASARGELVQPDPVIHNDPVRLENELVAARARLITALDGGASTRTPASAARAQAAFDCWNDEASDPTLAGTPVNPATGEPWMAAKVQNCRNSYFTAMNEVDARPVAAAPVAAAPRAAAPAAAVPAPRQQAYITFFDFDQSTVTAEGQAVLRTVSDNVRRGGVADVTITGNTDRSGTDGYNMALSQRRAEAVKAILVRNGVSSNVIVSIARGETQPLVATADGMREPQNRNVAVYIK